MGQASALRERLSEAGVASSLSHCRTRAVLRTRLFGARTGERAAREAERGKRRIVVVSLSHPSYLAYKIVVKIQSTSCRGERAPEAPGRRGISQDSTRKPSRSERARARRCPSRRMTKRRARAESCVAGTIEGSTAQQFNIARARRRATGSSCVVATAFALAVAWARVCVVCVLLLSELLWWRDGRKESLVRSFTETCAGAFVGRRPASAGAED